MYLGAADGEAQLNELWPLLCGRASVSEHLLRAKAAKPLFLV